MCTIVYVDEAASTNSLLASRISGFEHGSALAAHSQTAGRGQRGNSWESEPGKNLTFSVLLCPAAITASRQFELSQIVSLALVKVLREKLHSDEVYVKWPNDIYYKDKKLAGILIENALSGPRIKHSIVGIGLNVNQQTFESNAPNPVSMTNITGETYELDSLLETIIRRIVEDFDAYEQNPDPIKLAAHYRYMLWRGEGFWLYRDNATGREFKARIAAISPTGHLTLAHDSGAFKTYSFKEIDFVL